MNKIFSSLAIVANGGLLLAFALGLSIGDPTKLDPTTRRLISLHFLTALGVGMLVMLVHGIALTYFMGTGRWLEETIAAYKLPPTGREQNLKLKCRIVPALVLCIVLLVVTFAFGAMSDPGASHPKKWAPLVHFSLAITTVCTNMLVSYLEYRVICRNGQLVSEIYAAIKKIRAENGLE